MAERTLPVPVFPPSLWSRLHVVAWTLLVFLLGYSLGTFLLKVEEAVSPAPVRVLSRDRHRRAPFVHVQEIREGAIVGVVGTGARLVIGETVIVPHADRTFSLPAAVFLVNVVPVPVPRGAVFVASRRGKNYYPVGSPASERLVPENRIYFRSAEEAEALGYKKGY